MAAAAGQTARALIPRPLDTESLRASAGGCRACPLWRAATQTVFGEGRPHARLMLIGEQPGNEEDLSGRPFVGPAGRLLRESLAEAGIEPDDTYVTNVVKHFKWEPKGKRRLHKKPSAREIGACLPWLEAEIELVEPELLLLLGATAAQALLGRDFRVSLQRGELLPSKWAPQVLATIHPSAILRAPTSEARAEEQRHFGADLAIAARVLAAPKAVAAGGRRSHHR